MPIAIAIHGGAGTIRRADLNPERELAYRAGLEAALDAGLVALQKGARALDAVQAAVVVLEDDPLFNAGRGGVFNDRGEVELEAALMDGRTRAAGSVTGVRGVRNPVRLARAVMEHTPHVTLGFKAADALTARLGLPIEPPEYFHTDSRWQALRNELARLGAGGAASQASEQDRHGTVGAVALDMHGGLAAATSTGGRTAKMAGRVGDTPVFGAGTWADETVAVSCTGHGEWFVRCAVAHEISARMRLGGAGVVDAADEVVMRELPRIGGAEASGGVIAVDATGRVAMPFNSEGMYRACVDALGNRVVAIHR